MTSVSLLDQARRFERAEALANASFVEARARLQPESGAAWIDVAGAYAMFDEVESPLTQSFGVGVFDPFGAEELERVEAFFADRGAPASHEVCGPAEASVVRLLHDRAYRVVEESVVLIRATTMAPQTPSREIVVREIGEAEVGLWAKVSAEGWSTESAELAELVEGLGHVTARAEGMHCFLAEMAGDAIAAGGLSLQSGVALLAGASTVPRARRRGAQQALLRARLEFAAARGADRAMVVAAPGSGSMRNAQRQGFEPVYARKKWQRVR